MKLVRKVFTEEIYGVEVRYELHKPPSMQVPDVPDPMFWMKNHPSSPKSFRKWYVFWNREDFEKFFMTHQGVVPRLFDWHEGQKGDWVLADDGGICEIIIRNNFAGKQKNTYPGYVRTIVGSFVVNPRRRDKMPFYMDTEFEKHASRSTFSGVRYYSLEDYIRKKKFLGRREEIFAIDVAHGMHLVDAYQKCYVTDKDADTRKVEERALLLMKQERIKKRIMAEVKDIAKSLGIDDEYILKELKRMYEVSETENVKLEALKTLGKAIGTTTPETKKMMTGVVGYLQSFSLKGDVEELEDDMKVNLIEESKD